MQEPEFPTKTADTVIAEYVPRSSETATVGGITVWLQTLNTIHRDAVEREAQYAAQKAIRYLRKSTEDYKLLIEDLATAEVEDLVTMLADHQLMTGEWHTKSFDKYGDPQNPERLPAMSDLDYTELCAKWEADCTKCADKRVEFVEGERKAYEKKIRSWSQKTRAERAGDVYINTAFARAYNTRLLSEIILKAARTPEDHRKCFFSDIVEVEDLDDEVRKQLMTHYNELDTVKPCDIPT